MQVFHSYSHSIRLFSEFIDFHPSRNILSASRTGTERAAMVMRRGTGRGGPRALPASGVFEGLRIQRRRTGQTTAKGADGTSECPGGSPHERGARHKLLTLGHPAGRQIHPRAERRRKAASEAPVQLKRPRSPQLSHCPCAVDFRTACGLPAWLAGGRGSGLLPSVPHALTEQKEQK